MQPQPARRPAPALRLFLSFARNTPLCRGVMRRYVLRFLKKKISYPIITDFRGTPFIFNLDNTTEEKALLGQYNLAELKFLKESTNHPDAVFIDLGANSGFYTQNFIADHIADQGAIALAIEPNPQMCRRIRDNYALLQKYNPENHALLIIENCAIGGDTGEMHLDLSNGMGAANIVSRPSSNTIRVSMDTLENILKKHNIQKIDVMKIDIEGYEDRALIPFFTTSAPSLFPRHIIIEHTSSDEWEGDLFSILNRQGYQAIRKTRGNLLLSRKL